MLVVFACFVAYIGQYGYPSVAVQNSGDVKNRRALTLKKLEKMKSSLPWDGVLRISFFLGEYSSL